MPELSAAQNSERAWRSRPARFRPPQLTGLVQRFWLRLQFQLQKPRPAGTYFLLETYLVLRFSVSPDQTP